MHVQLKIKKVTCSAFSNIPLQLVFVVYRWWNVIDHHLEVVLAVTVEAIKRAIAV